MPLHLAPRLPWAALATGSVWLLVAASVVHWSLRLGVQGDPLSSQTQTVGIAQAAQGDPARLFSRAEVAAAPAPSPARDRFRVLGVAAQAGDGWALMSVDGKPPRAYRRGAAVDAQWQVLSITQRRIDIGPAQGAAVVSIDLPGLPPAATGQLPPAGGLEAGPSLGPGGAAGPAPTPAADGVPPVVPEQALVEPAPDAAAVR